MSIYLSGPFGIFCLYAILTISYLRAQTLETSSLPPHSSARSENWFPVLFSWLVFVLFYFVCLFVFIFTVLFFFFLLAKKFGLLVLLHFMTRSLHLQFKSEISKCFLASVARPVGLTDNDNDKLRNVLL